MAWIPVNTPPGVNRQATPFDVPNVWWDTNNVRWVSGAITPIGGNIRVTSSATASPIRKLFQWRDNSAQTWMAIGHETGVQIQFGSTYNATPASFQGITGFGGGGGYGTGQFGAETYGTPRSVDPAQFRKPNYWSFATFGQDLLGVCSSDGRLLHFSPTTPSTPMDVPTNAPVSNTAVVVTAERAAMLLGAGGYPRRIAWSDLENYNGWTFNSTTGQAGYIDIEATSPIVSGTRVKEGVLVLTQHEAFLVRYVGAPFFYGVEKLGATTFSAPNALATGGNMTVWFGDESFWRYDGGAVRPLACPMFNDIKQDLDPVYTNYRAHMHENGVFPEFWFEYPNTEQTDGENNRYVIYNYAENWWARGSRRRTAACGASTADFPLASGLDKIVYRHEYGTSDDGISRVGSVWAETSVLDFGSRGNLFDVNQAMVAIDPTISSQNYQLKILSRFTPNGAETTFGPYKPRDDGYTDLRAAARDMRVRVEAIDDQYWSFGQFRLDIAANGGQR